METTLLEKPEEELVVGIPMSKQEFLNWNPEDDFLYEFDNELAIPTDGMRKEERYLVRNIQKAFRKTRAFEENGCLFEESAVWVTDNQKRIPDMAYFTDAQISESATAESEPIPSFVVEIISPTDTVKHVEQKIIEYFAAGVRVVWHIHPELRMVRVFTSPRHNVTCFENDAFDAAPAIPDMQLTVEALFTVE